MHMKICLTCPRSRFVSGFVSGGALLLLLNGAASAIDPVYTLVNQQTGINATTVPADGYTGMHDRMAGGMSVGDFNNDSWPDLYISGLGTVDDMLYINQQDGTFVDQAQSYGIAYRHFGVGSAVGDVNNDGLPDLYVVSYGPSDAPAGVGMNLLYINNGPDKNGQYSFTEEAAQRGVNDIYGIVGGKGVAFGDMDLDGDLDLYVATWGFTPGGNRLFENDGTGHYNDVSASVLPDNPVAIRGFTPKFVDVTGDRYPDLLLTADFTTSHLYVNNGPDKNGQISYRNTTDESGIISDNNGMGATVNDFDGDGVLDWFQTNIYVETANFFNTMFMCMGNNEAGNPVFVDQAVERGVGDVGWGWGVVSGDYDNDGDIDIVATNGWPSWPNEPTRYWRNGGSGNFADVSLLTGLTFHINGRGLTQFDYDKDGDLDLAFIDNGGPFRIYRNDLPFDEATRYLRVNLNTDRHPCLAPMGYGTRIIATYGGKEHLRVIDGASSYLGQSELTLHFGLGETSTVDSLRIEWNDGSVTTLNDVPGDQEITVFAYHPIDLNEDGQINYFDVSAFFHAYIANDDQADINGDAVINVLDIMSFVADFNEPCS
jgi:enediyne biosynthesis protein E4